MEDQFQILFNNMKIEMQKQTAELKESITNTVMETLDEKLKPIIAENKDLKTKLVNLEKKMEYLRREKTQNNLIIFGLREEELIKEVKKIFNYYFNFNIGDFEINNINRIGKKIPDGKLRLFYFPLEEK